MIHLSLIRCAFLSLLLLPLVSAAITLKLESHPREDDRNVERGLQERSHQLVRYSIGADSDSSVPISVRLYGRGRSRPKRQDVPGMTDSESTHSSTSTSSSSSSSSVWSSSTSWSSSGDSWTTSAQPTSISSGSATISETTSGEQTQNPVSPQSTSSSSQYDSASSTSASSAQNEHYAETDSSSSTTYSSTTSSPAESTGAVDFADSSTSSESGSRTQNDPSSTSGDGVALPLNSKDSGGAAFTVQVEVAGKLMKLLTDTGSSQIWVASQDCSTCTAGHMEVAPVSLDSGCSKIQQDYVGDNWVSGCDIQTDIRIGEYNLPNQHLLAVDSMQATMLGHGEFMSGIIGFGMAQNKKVEGDPPLVRLFGQHMIDSPTVGFYLDRDWQNENSEVTIGDVTESEHVNPSTGITLPRAQLDGDADHGWQIVDIDGHKVGDQQVYGSARAIIDTGATLMYIPEATLRETYARLGNGVGFQAGSTYALKCMKEEGMQDLIVSIGGKDWSVAYEDLVWYELDSYPGYCAGRVLGLPADSVYQYQLGGPFLRNVYTSFNIIDGSVTFYELAQ